MRAVMQPLKADSAEGGRAVKSQAGGQGKAKSAKKHWRKTPRLIARPPTKAPMLLLFAPFGFSLPPCLAFCPAALCAFCLYRLHRLAFPLICLASACIPLHRLASPCIGLHRFPSPAPSLLGSGVGVSARVSGCRLGCRGVGSGVGVSGCRLGSGCRLALCPCPCAEPKDCPLPPPPVPLPYPEGEKICVSSFCKLLTLVTNRFYVVGRLLSDC